VAPELDVRLLRYFVAVAEELHFTRAANRLFVAQQALSRDIRRLEERVGVPLLDRTTRRVTLTPAGEQLLLRARELLVLHDQMVRELQGFTDRIVVDVVGHGLTPETVLSAARRGGPGVEYFAEFQGVWNSPCRFCRPADWTSRSAGSPESPLQPMAGSLSG
jgi:Bacterial regulatory helix-turn-helix protein, lysR family